MCESDSTVSYFPMKYDEWKLMSICQLSFTRTKEKGNFRLDFLDFPDVLFSIYLCCFKKASKQTNKQKRNLHLKLILVVI